MFAVLGIAGSALEFRPGIDVALHRAVEAPLSDLPDLTSPTWDRVLATGHVRWHYPGDKWTLEVTAGGGLIPARYCSAFGQGRHADRMIWLSYDGIRIVRAGPRGQSDGWLYHLHMALFAGDPGGQVVGCSDAAMLVPFVSGIAACGRAIAGKRRSTSRSVREFVRGSPDRRHGSSVTVG